MSYEVALSREHPLVFQDEFASREDACLHAMHQRAYEEVIPYLKGATLLDLGCNNGYGSALLAAHAARVVGLDISSSAISDAQRRFQLPNLQFMSYSGNSIPSSDNCFDVVVSFQVIEHVVDIPAYLSEISRVLRDSGVVFFSTPNRLIRLDHGMPPWNEFHVREFSPSELERMLSESFSDVVIKGVFASPSIYRIEYNRCQRIRAAARGDASLNERLIRGIASRAVRLRDRLLKALNRIRISTGHFYYSSQRLDVALDLLAICRKQVKA